MKYFAYCRKSQEAEDRQALSIPAQREEATRVRSACPDIEDIEFLEEKMSAKYPGRPVFDEMMRRIERGEAGGILTWHPDRLARNSIDGGLIIYLLDRGVLKDLKFASYNFDNSSRGKFMLQIMFGYSKYYVDSLSENVKRGNRAKIERGWRPNMAPLGYLNDPTTKTIVSDPEHFPLIRQMFDLMLTGAYSPKEIALVARDQWGFRTPQRRKIGGTPLALSTIYHILNNEFYAGMIKWSGQLYPGKHEPIISIEEFERVQAMLARPNQKRPHTYEFAFTGMIRCVCGLSITAEHKRNRYGYHYVYYHCTQKRLDQRCTERAVEVRNLEFQIRRFISALTIDPRIEICVIQLVRARGQRVEADRAARRGSLETSRAAVLAQQKELTSLRVRKLLSDEEYLAERERLQREELRLNQTLSADKNETGDMFEPFECVILFRQRALVWFEKGDDRSKRIVLETIGSNLVLGSKILSIDTIKPFAVPSNFQFLPNLLAGDDDVREKLYRQSGITTFIDKTLDALRDMSDADRTKMVSNIKLLRERFEKKNLWKVA